MSETLPDHVQDLRDLLQAGVAHPVGGVIRRLERQSTTVPERAMRRTLAAEVVSELEEVELVGLLAMLVDRISEGHPAARQVLHELALEPSVFQELPYERVSSAYGIAQQAELGGIAKMFLGATLDDVGVSAAHKGNRHLDLPLGVRRAAARGTNRFKLDRLLHDRDPLVIAALLENPRLIERDVIKVAAMRPTRPEVLEVVAGHARWSSRYRVRKALACNPWTPRPIARRLLPTLMVQDLQLALEAGVFSEDIRPEVAALLADRKQRARRASRGVAVPGEE